MVFSVSGCGCWAASSDGNFILFLRFCGTMQQALKWMQRCYAVIITKKKSENYSLVGSITNMAKKKVSQSDNCHQFWHGVGFSLQYETALLSRLPCSLFTLNIGTDSFSIEYSNALKPSACDGNRLDWVYLKRIHREKNRLCIQEQWPAYEQSKPILHLLKQIACKQLKSVHCAH